MGGRKVYREQACRYHNRWKSVIPAGPARIGTVSSIVNVCFVTTVGQYSITSVYFFLDNAFLSFFKGYQEVIAGLSTGFWDIIYDVYLNMFFPHKEKYLEKFQHAYGKRSCIF